MPPQVAVGAMPGWVPYTVGAAYLSWQNSGALVRVGGNLQSSWAATFGATGGTSGRTHISPGSAVLHETTIRRVELLTSAVDTTAGWKVKLLRRVTNTSWDVLSEQVFTASVGTNVVNLDGDGWTAQVGDVLGVFVPAGAGNSASTKAGGFLPVRYSDTDATSAAASIPAAGPAGYVMNITAYGQRAFIAVAGDSIYGGNLNWQTESDGSPLASGANTVPGGSVAFALEHLVDLGERAAVVNQGHGGYTWANAAGTGTGWDEAARSDPNTVVLGYGVNDVAQGRTWAQIEANLDTIKGKWGTSDVVRVFITETLPWTGASAAQAAEIRSNNASMETWCAANGVTLIPTWAEFGQARVSTGFNDDLITAYNADGIHLTADGMALLGSLISAAL